MAAEDRGPSSPAQDGRLAGVSRVYEEAGLSSPSVRELAQRFGVANDEMRRIIREEEPPRPSTRISTLGQAADTIAAQRHSDPNRLRRLCRGELDWIVMKCLEKDRHRRYETANGLAMEIQRYLADEPVLAGPPGIAYRTQKFLRRNKGPVLTLAVVLLALLGVYNISQAANAERQLSRLSDGIATQLVTNGVVGAPSYQINYTDLHYANDSAMLEFPLVLSDSYSKNENWASDIRVQTHKRVGMNSGL